MSVIAGKTLGDGRSVVSTDGDDTVRSGFIPLTGLDLVLFPDLRLPETVSGLLIQEERASAFVWRSI